jgi:crossover junction endodeoxyribonuclease RusA
VTLQLLELEFAVRGLPVAQGGASAFVVGGRARIVTKGKDPRTTLGSWRSQIAAAAGEAMGGTPALTSPVTVSVHFVFPRPASHFLPANRSRPEPELRLDAPRYVAGKPDLDKLLRGLLDGITHVVVADDAQVAGIMAWKVYEDDERRPGCQVRVTPLARTR